jgi:hypothetical protein
LPAANNTPKIKILLSSILKVNTKKILIEIKSIDIYRSGLL